MFQPHPETRLRSREWRHTVSVPPAPRQNYLFVTLPQEDYERLLPQLEPVPLPLGWTVYDAGEWQKYLYFPVAGIVSKIYVTVNGASSQCAVVCNEGVIDVSLFLGSYSTPCQATEQSAGYAYRLKVGLLNNEIEHNGSLLNLLLHYTQALITQTTQSAMCNRYHSLDQQLCRWILSCLDRASSNELTMTQERIAQWDYGLCDRFAHTRLFLSRSGEGYTRVNGFLPRDSCEPINSRYTLPK